MKKIRILFIAFFLLVTTACGSQATNNQGVEDTAYQQQFNDFLTEMFVDDISGDYLSLHFSLVNPESYGIEKPELTLGHINETTIQEAENEVEETLNRLREYDINKLSATQKIDYLQVEKMLEIELMSNGLSDYQNLFSPANSVTDNLVVNFNEFKFYNEEDVQDYLVLLQDVPRYLDEALAFTQQQAEKQMFMPDYALEDTVYEIEKFLDKEGDNALIISFENKMKDVDFATEDYIKQNRQIVNDRIIPAYQKTKDTLLSFQGNSNNQTLADTANGKKYYEALYYSKTGSKSDPEAMVSIAEKYIDNLIGEMMIVVMADQEAYDRYLSLSLAEESPENLLAFFKDHLTVSFPQAPDVNYQATYLDPSITNESTVAYYLIPPFDLISDNVIKINPTATHGDMEQLYTTIAHEGYPGHLYQTTYYYNTKPHPIRTQTRNLGYVEGWAMYVQGYSLKWKLADDEAVANLSRINTELNYVLQSIVDIGVNYLGWKQAEVKQLLRENNLVDSDELVESLYQSVTADPGLLLPYGIGLIEMTQLRKDTEKQLGNQFDEVDYHQVILDHGPLTFDLLAQQVDQYIKEHK